MRDDGANIDTRSEHEPHIRLHALAVPDPDLVREPATNTIGFRTLAARHRPQRAPHFRYEPHATLAPPPPSSVLMGACSANRSDKAPKARAWRSSSCVVMG